MKPSLKVIVRGTKVTAELTDVLTSGMKGVPVEFQFDEDWGDLRKLGVFEGSDQKKYLDLNLGGELTIPWEVLTEERTLLKVGVEWRKADGTVVIPTRWTEVGVVLPGAQAGNDPALEPSPTVYDQIMQAIESGRLKGADGPTPYIGENGTWWLGKEDTGIKAEGKDGYTPVKGKDYFDGKDGYTPQRGVDYWTEADQQAINAHIAEEVAALGDHSTIVCEAKGENILVTDSAKAKLRGLVMYGKSEQFTTTGAQLLQLDDATTSSNGISAIVKRGAVAISGTATDGTSVIVLKGKYNGTEAVVGLAPGDYKLTGDYLHVQIRKADGTTRNTSSAYSLTLADGEYIVCVFLHISKGTAVNTTVYPMISAGTTALPWEPYTGGKPSPSPEYPQEIVSAGQDGDIGAKVCGAQLFDNTDYADIDINGAGAIRSASLIPVTAGTYTLSRTSGGINVYCRTYIDGIMGGGQNIPENTTYKMVFNKPGYIVLSVDIGATIPSVTDLMVNAGATALPFEQYKGQALTVLTPNGLPGIKVASGGNWTDSTGQQWVTDEIDFARGVYVQRCKVVNLGDYEWKDDWNNYYNIPGTFLAYRNFPDGVKHLGGKGCNVTHLSYGNAILTMSETIFDVGQGGGYSLGIRVPTSIASTKEELKAWCAENNVKFLYRLATTIETPLTEEELAQYRELLTNYPTTTATNNAGVGMKVSYVADAKNYIDKKINELRLAIVANV